MREERREHQRVPLRVRLTARFGGHDLSATTEDVSVGGAKICFARESSLPVGERVAVVLDLPGSKPVEAEAEVRWHGGQRCGLRFGPRAQAAVAAFIAGVVGLASSPTQAASTTVPTFDPEATVHLQSDGSERPDEYVLEQAFRQQYGQLDQCVAAAKEGDDDSTLGGQAEVEVLLNPNGHRPLGVNAKLSGDNQSDAQLVECVRQASAGAPYPQYDGPPVVAVFDFELDAGYVDEDE